jgi:predicted HAD superfamily phosphohydrolase YqeG
LAAWNPWAGYRISEIMGIKAPISGYHTIFGQPIYAPEAGITCFNRAIESRGKRVIKKDRGMLDRIDSLRKRSKR